MKTTTVMLTKSIRAMWERSGAYLASLHPQLKRFARGAGVFWRAAGYYIALAVLLVLLGSAAYSYRHRPQKSPSSPAEVSVAAIPEEAVWFPDIAFPTLSPTPSPEPFALTAPVPGEVLQPIALDSLVWSPGLGQWQTHSGVDFATEVGEAVCAAESGTVTGAYRDPLLGCTIELRHDNGWITRYASLNAVNLVKPGQRVEKGEVIASAGDSADAEAGLGPHLHFELLIDGKPAEPFFPGQAQDAQSEPNQE